MAKPARGLPEGFSIDLPDEKPVQIGDYLDETALPVVRKERPVTEPPKQHFRPEIVREQKDEVGERERPLPRSAAQPSIIRYQLNLSPKAKLMFEELVEHVRTYSPQNDASASEVFHGILTVLHNAIDDLELSELPRRGAWGSVTAKNFPGALSEAFEVAILRAAQKSRRVS